MRLSKVGISRRPAISRLCCRGILDLLARSTRTPMSYCRTPAMSSKAGVRIRDRSTGLQPDLTDEPIAGFENRSRSSVDRSSHFEYAPTRRCRHASWSSTYQAPIGSELGNDQNRFPDDRRIRLQLCESLSDPSPVTRHPLFAGSRARRSHVPLDCVNARRSAFAPRTYSTA